MSRYSLLLFFILFESLQGICSGDDSYNPFSPPTNKNSRLESAEVLRSKEMNYESNESPLDKKIIEKRRLFFNDDDVKSPVPTDRSTESNENLDRRRTNYSESEMERQMPEFQQRQIWDNERNRFSLLGPTGNFRNTEEAHSRQGFVAQANPNQRLDWEKRGDIFGKGHSRWNEENKFKPFENPAPNLRMTNNYNGRTPAMFSNNEMNFYSEDRTHDLYNRRGPTTTSGDREMGSIKNYNEQPGDMYSGYVDHPNVNYYNRRNLPGLWSSNFNTPEKGVIINFNTECPKPNQFSSNQLVHKFIFTPKTPLENFQESEVISSPRINPMYYV